MTARWQAATLTGRYKRLPNQKMTIPYATVIASMICQNGAHVASFRGARDGWEAVLGADRPWDGRIQHAESQPHRFECGAWTPAVGFKALSGR